GFAATDFVITITLSAADAAQHAVENPLLHPFLGAHRLGLTLALLLLLAAVFMIGFKEAIRIAMVVAVPYIGLNLSSWSAACWKSSGGRRSSTPGGPTWRCTGTGRHCSSPRPWSSRGWPWASPASRPACR
ncbi:MAG TPA: hypothetical protein VN898_01095, partial [Candidatus Binatia bacterium]|nr:hypothetical protein [Candidatus Binatia bacterium]